MLHRTSNLRMNLAETFFKRPAHVLGERKIDFMRHIAISGIQLLRSACLATDLSANSSHLAPVGRPMLGFRLLVKTKQRLLELFVVFLIQRVGFD